MCIRDRLYSLVKLLQVVRKSNPNISQHTKTSYYDFSEVVNVDEIGFKFAFSVEGYFDKEQKNDPRYVKYMARVRGIYEGRPYERILPIHECTEEDWAEFPEAANASAGTIKRI